MTPDEFPFPSASTVLVPAALAEYVAFLAVLSLLYVEYVED